VEEVFDNLRRKLDDGGRIAATSGGRQEAQHEDQTRRKGHGQPQVLRK
jgi:hypothetical protein